MAASGDWVNALLAGRLRLPPDFKGDSVSIRLSLMLIWLATAKLKSSATLIKLNQMNDLITLTFPLYSRAKLGFFLLQRGEDG